MNDERITTIDEDDSDAWNHQLELEERQRRESETGLDSRTQEVIETLSKCIALLSGICRKEYPVIADLHDRLAIEREFLRTKQGLTLNNLVKTARRLLVK
jgi:hypothetical protein